MDIKAISVDDNEINLFQIETFAEELHLAVASFTDPLKALASALADDPDIIFLDYMMPEMDGISFVKAYRKQNPKTPIIMITAEGTDAVKIRALKAGVTDFLTKPFDSAEFMARTTNILNVHFLQKQVEHRSIWLEEEVAIATKRLLESERETLTVMAKASEFKDLETELHTERVAGYSHLLAGEYGLSAREQEVILMSAPLHDIGKIGIPDGVLLKKGKFTPEEFDVMKQHTTYGYRILENTRSEYLVTGRAIALNHHERYDGSGYPAGRKGYDIPISARIVAIADVFDALLSARPYKAAWTVDAALAYLHEERGRQFDPLLTDLFLKNTAQLLRLRDLYR